MAYGFAGHIGIAKEATWGSGVAATDYMEALSEDLSREIERFSHKAIIGSLAEPDDTPGQRRTAGSIRMAAHPVSIGWLLKGALNTKSVTSIVAGLYRNDFFTTAGGTDFSADVPIQPFSVEVFRDVTSSVRYTGCVINTLDIEIANGAAVMCNAAFIGRGHEVITKTTPTFPGSPSKPFAFDTVSLSIGGAATALIETMTVQINNNLQGLGALNLSTDIAKVRRTDHQMINVNGTLDFSDMTEYLKFINQTEQALKVSMTKADSFSMIIDIPRLVYTAFPLGIPGKERITVNFTGKGFYHAGSGNAIKISLTTTTSHY